MEAVATHGCKELKQSYLSKLVAGEWTATMNLTEPQAGSDLSAIRTRAEPCGDGSYRIRGGPACDQAADRSRSPASSACVRSCASGSLCANAINTPTRRVRSVRCARATTGQATALPRRVMKCRRLMRSPNWGTGIHPQRVARPMSGCMG